MTTQLRPLPRHQRRHSLAVTSALLVVWSVSGNAMAGNPLPTTPNPTVGTPVITPGIDGGGNATLTVTLIDPSTVINWDSFDIGAVNTVTYNGSGKAVLNRVTGATASDINGTLNASGVQFWLLNPNGILVNNGASINTGSFFASTLSMSDGVFTGGGGFTLSGSTSNAIVVQNGASITTSGGPLVLAGQDITVGGVLTANSGGDLALVAATDLTIAAAPFSPLSITVNAGTTVATAKVQVGGTGQLTGKSIIVAGKVDGSSPALLDDLLNIASGATLTATTTGGRIILSAGGIDVASGSAAGITGLTGGASAGIDSSGTLDAASDLLMGATGNLTQAGDVTAGGDYNVTADDAVFLAGTQAAAGQVVVQGTAVTATGTLSLTSNSADGHAAGAPAGAMSIASTTGDIDLGSTSTLKGGIANHTDVTLTSAAGANVVVGTVTTRSLGGLSGQTGNVTVGDVSVDTALDIETTGGNVTTKGLTVGATGQNATISASGTATVDGAVSVSGDYAVTGNAVALGGVQGAHGKVTVQATGGDITATATALTLTSNKDDAHAAGNAAGAMALTAASGKVDLAASSTLKGGGTARLSDITVTTGAGKAAVLGTVTARSLGGLSGQTGNVSVGDVTVDTALDIETTGGTVTTKALTVGGTGQNATISASGTATVDGAVSVSGDYAVTGNAVALGGIQGAHGKVTALATGGDITATALTLTSNKDDAHAAGNAAGAMALTAASGKVDIGTSSTLKGGGTARLSDITVTTGAGKAVVLGTVAARSLAGLAAQSGDITTGGITVDRSLDLKTTAGTITTGAVTVGGSNQTLGIDASGDVKAGVVSVSGDAVVKGANIRIASVTSSTGDVDVEAVSDLTGQALVVTPASLADYGRANLTASAAGKTVTANATAGTAKLGTVTAGDGSVLAATTQVDIEGEAVDVTSAEAKDAKLFINTTTGDAVVGTAAAKADVQILSAGNIRLTSATSSTGNVDVEAADDLTGQALVVTPASLADYGRANLTASAAGKTVTAKATAGTAKLGTVTAGDGSASGATTQVDIEGDAVDVTSAEAKDRKLYIQATGHDVVADTAKAKSDIQVLAAANIRTGTATSTAGSLQFTADTGDISGLAISPAATDFRLLSGFGRAGLTASGQGQTITVTATHGNIQAGTVTAGTGTASPPAATDEITLTAGKAMDVTAANARDGKLTAMSQDGNLVLVTATGAGGVSLEADKGATAVTASIRADTVSSAKGDIALTADNGDITATAATPGGTNYQRMDITAGGTGKTIVASAIRGTVLFDAVTAGDGTTTLAGNQVDVSAHDIIIADVTATEGGIVLSTAVAGGGNDISVGTGHAKTFVRLTADRDAGATALTADTAEVSVTAARAATVSGGVSAGTNYLVIGQSVTLGDTATPATQTAGGLVRIVSTAGGISGRGALVLKSDGDNSGGEPILLDATGGNIDFAAGSTLQGGSNRTGKIGIRLGTAGSDLSLGTVNARGLYGIDGTEAFLGSLTTSGDVTLGATSLRNALTLETTGGDIHTATITTSGDGQSLSLKASGDIVAGGFLSSQGNLRLDATNVGITTAQSHKGTATLIASAAATGTSLKALGSVSETANSDQITTTVGGAAATVSADSPTDPGTHANSGTGAGGTSFGVGYDEATPATSAVPDPTQSDVIITGAVIDKATVTASRDIIITAGNSGTATNGSATVTTATAGRDATLTAWAGAGATAPADGNVTVATAKAGRDLTLTTTGAAAGDVIVTSTAQGSYTNTVTGNVQIHAAGDVQAADIKALKGSIDVAAGDSASLTNGAATVTSATASNDITIAAWAGAGASLPSNGSVTVDTATAGGDLALTTTGLAKGGIFVTTIAQGSFGGTLTGDVSVNSAGDVRAKEITAAKGNITITAADDISGTKAVATPASITDYNRAVVTASGQDKTIRIEATNGKVRLGAVSAGSGTTVLAPGTQVWIQGKGIDADSVAATNGSVFLNAFDPASELVVTSVTARTNGDIEAANSVRLGTVVATDGYISIAATNGDVSGLKRSVAATDGRLLAGYDRSTLTAGGDITIHADGTSGNVQTGTMTAGGDLTGTGQAIDSDYGYANGGDLLLTSASGDVRLIQGHARDNATIQAAANARVGGLDATNANAAITATTGAATGLAGAGEASNLDAAFGRTVVAAGHDIQVAAHDLAQLGDLTAGNDVTVAATVNAAQVDGTVQANGAYDVSGTSVVLGHAAATQAQSAKGLVRLTATAGDITSRGVITLTANSDDTAATAEPMFLKATGGNIDFSSGTLKGGTSRTSNIGVYLGTAGADLSLGTVQARGLYGLNPAETLLADLTTSGDIRLGATSVRNTLDLVTTGGDIVTTGDVSVTGVGQGLSFDTYGAAGHDITAGGVLSAQGYLNLASARNVSLTTAISNAGAISVVAGGNASGTLLQANRGVSEVVGGDDNIVDSLGQQAATTAPDSDAFAIPMGGVTGDPVSAPPGGTGAGGGVGPGPVFDDVYISAGTVTKSTVSGGHDVSIIATTGDANVGTATAGNDLSVRSDAANVRLDTGTATSGTATITTALAATGRAGASSGKDAAFKRMDLDADSAVVVTSGTLSQLGTVTADSGVITVTAGSSATPRNGAIDIASADAGTTLSLKAWSNSNAAAVGNGDILVGMAVADGGATLDSSTGSFGNIVITNGLTASNSAVGDAILKAAGFVRFDAVTAKAGSVAITAGGDVSGLARMAAATDGRLLAGYDRGNVTAGGDGHTVSVTAASGAVQLGTVNAGATGTSVTTDQLSVTARAIDLTSATAYNGKLKLNATAGDVVLHDGTAEGGATATASASIRAGSITSKSGDITLTATAGDATGLATTATPTTLADYGRADLTAQGNGKTVTVAASNGNARLGTVVAGDGTTAMTGDQVTVSAKGVDVTSATAKDGGLNLAATAGDVVLHDGAAGGDTTATASANIRVGSVTSKSGNLTLTATSGDATGLAMTATPTSLADYGRADLTAQKNGKAVKVTASNGNAKLGTVSAGDGTTATTGDQVAVSAKAIDITSAVAKDADLTLSATATDIALGTASARGKATVTALRSVTGNLIQSTDKAIAVEATNGDIVLTTGTAGTSATLKAGGNARLGTVTSAAGGTSVTAVGDISGLARTAAATDGRLLTGFDRADIGASGDGQTVTLTGTSVQVGTVTAGTTTAATSGTQIGITAGGIDATTAIANNGALDLLASTGNIKLGTGTATGNAALTTTATGADIAVTTALTGASVAVTSADDANLAAVTSKIGDVSVAAATIEVVSVSAKTALSLVSTGNLSLGGGSAGTTALLKTTGTGDIALTGSLTSGDKTTVASVSGATLGDITAKGADITVAKTARLAAITATGQDVSLHALDADLTGDIKASTITITTDQKLTLGDQTGAFNLSSTELNHLKASGGANTVTLSAGSFGIAAGNVDWSLPDSATTANLFTTGRVDITGRFALDPTASGSASTTSRTLVIGGTTTGGSMASVIRVAATAGGGGRIDVGNGTVDLRGASIGVGEDEAFLATLGLTGTGTPVSAATVATAYVAQPESSLYRARSLYTDPVLVRAGALKVAYSNFALFQNTGVIGLNSGVQAMGGLPTIVLTGSGSANAFALFGNINGIGGQAAALLGPTVIAVNGAVPGNSRINGCVIGAATACLASSLSQPPLNVFDSSKVAVLSTVSPDLSFDTGISSSNESLFSDIAAPATQQDNCDPTTAANCPTKETHQ